MSNHMEAANKDHAWPSISARCRPGTIAARLGLGALLAFSIPVAARWPGAEFEPVFTESGLNAGTGDAVVAMVRRGDGLEREALFFSAQVGLNQPWRLWVSDGTPEGSARVADHALSRFTQGVWAAQELGVYYRGEDPTLGWAYFHAQEIGAPPQLVFDGSMVPGFDWPSHPVGYRVVSFRQEDGTGRALVVDPRDGSHMEAQMPETAVSLPVARTDDALQFAAWGTGSTLRLKTLDVATGDLANIPPPSPHPDWNNLHRMGGAAGFACMKDYFAGPPGGFVAFCSDGTTAGTFRVTPPDAVSLKLYDDAEFTRVGARLLFYGSPMSEDNAPAHWRLWSIDGTPEGLQSLFGGGQHDYRLCSAEQDGRVLVQVVKWDAPKVVVEYWWTDGSNLGSTLLASNEMESWDTLTCQGEGAIIVDGAAALVVMNDGTLLRIDALNGVVHEVPGAPAGVKLVRRIGPILVLVARIEPAGYAVWRYVPDRVFAHGFD